MIVSWLPGDVIRNVLFPLPALIVLFVPVPTVTELVPLPTVTELVLPLPTVIVLFDVPGRDRVLAVSGR